MKMKRHWTNTGWYNIFLSLLPLIAGLTGPVNAMNVVCGVLAGVNIGFGIALLIYIRTGKL